MLESGGETRVPRRRVNTPPLLVASLALVAGHGLVDGHVRFGNTLDAGKMSNEALVS
jgi:hypothetical protein